MALIVPLIISKKIYHTSSQMSTNKYMNVLVVQPNINPYSEKFSLTQDIQTDLLLHLAMPKINHKLDFLILPEGDTL